jgi:dihydrofolate reductase
MLTIIVAVADNFAIGKDNRLLCHIPGDLKRFKEITSGHSVIMGKRTWESLPNRPLPNRRNMVLTDQPDEIIEGCVMAYSIEDVMNKLAVDTENFIIGGGMVYRQFLPLADKLLITRVYKSFEADAFFPEVKENEWVLESEEEHAEFEEFRFSYQTWVRK